MTRFHVRFPRNQKKGNNKNRKNSDKTYVSNPEVEALDEQELQAELERKFDELFGNNDEED